MFSDAVIIETNINQTNREIADMVTARNPDVVGISAYIWNAARLPFIIGLIRERLPDMEVVLGGPEAVHNADYWLGQGVSRVFRDEPARDEPAEEFTDPFTPEYIAALNGKIAYLETSRGCPYSCSYCLSGRDDNLRFLPLEQAKERIYKLACSDAKMVKFVDRTFNCNAERAYRIIDFIIGLNTDKCFHFEVAADLFDERTLDLLSTAPPARFQLEIGIQSFHLPALRAVNRVTDLSKAADSIRRLAGFGNMHIHVDLIAGLPYETLSDFRDSFNSAYGLQPHNLQLGFLKMLHGSRIREEYTSILFTDEPPYEITGSPWLSESDITLLKACESALQSTYNKSRFLGTIKYILSVSGLTPFDLYRELGRENSPQAYAEKLYRLFPEIPLEHLICDWLSAFKGENMPRFMRIYAKPRHIELSEIAQERLGRTIPRNQAALLPNGKGAFIDERDRDPVTGLYRLFLV
jgi:hypothetical protein